MADLKTLEARICSLLRDALQAARDGNLVDWRTRPDVLADEMIRWIADAVEDETRDLRAAVARAEQTAADARRVVVVLDRRRGRVYSITADQNEAQRHVRELVAKYGNDPNAASMTVGVVGEALAADVPAAPHRYLSTACQHSLHDRCGEGMRARGEDGRPHCKFCDAVCECPCHEADVPAAAGEVTHNVIVTACETCGETNHWCTCNAVDRGAA